MSRLVDQPSSISSQASESSSSGCVGGLPRTPKSLGVSTMPLPNRCPQTRFTQTRAVSGLLRLATASAISRRPLPCWKATGLSVGRQNREESPIDFGTGAAGIAAEEDHWVVRLVGVDELRRRIFARFFGCAGEYAVEGVVVGGADWIELVVVAAGAGDGEAHQAARDDVDAVVDDILLNVEKSAAKREEASGRCAGFVVDLVGRDLGDDEFVERPIGVEAGDDPIAVGIGLLVVAVFLEDVALRIGIAGDIEPMPSPAFAEARRCEQAIDGGLVFRVAGVGGEGVEFFGRWRQADQVVIQAGDTRREAELGAMAKVFWLPSRARMNRSISVRAAAACATFGGGGALGMLEGPVFSRDLAFAVVFWFFSAIGVASVRGSGRAERDPLHEVVDDGIGQFAARRHLVRLVAQGRDEQAFVRLVGNDCGTRFAAGPHSFGRVEPQAGSDLLGLCRNGTRSTCRPAPAECGFRRTQCLPATAAGPSA